MKLLVTFLLIFSVQFTTWAQSEPGRGLTAEAPGTNTPPETPAQDVKGAIITGDQPSKAISKREAKKICRDEGLKGKELMKCVREKTKHVK